MSRQMQMWLLVEEWNGVIVKIKMPFDEGGPIILTLSIPLTHRSPQTCIMCWPVGATSWSAVVWSRWRARGRWPPTSSTAALTVSGQPRPPTPVRTQPRADDGRGRLWGQETPTGAPPPTTWKRHSGEWTHSAWGNDLVFVCGCVCSFLCSFCWHAPWRRGTFLISRCTLEPLEGEDWWPVALEGNDFAEVWKHYLFCPVMLRYKI